MYILTDEERRYISQGLLPAARREGVVEELRGWSWPMPPLKPMYVAPLDLSEVAGSICPTGRDVYLARVQGIQPPPGPSQVREAALEAVVTRVILDAKRLIYRHAAACLPHLEQEAAAPLTPVGLSPWTEVADPELEYERRLIRSFEWRRVMERVSSALAAQPRAGADALVALALPVHVETRLDGQLLGLSRHARAGAVSLPQHLAMVLRFGPATESDRLRLAGAALLLEALHESPVDLGCVVSVQCQDERVIVEREVQVIGDELRQMFIQERDERQRAVFEELDPGLPVLCPEACTYLSVCMPRAVARQAGPERPVLANVGADEPF